ncbi:MAG TPA: hypothetical protein PLK06_02415 [bacterium]|nr:hypothetical protein [bacterium]
MVNVAPEILAEIGQDFKCYNTLMFHLHNQYMRGTRLDALVGGAVLFFVIFVLVTLIGPVRALSKARDEIRTSHVRGLMTKVLQLELVDSEAYTRLVADVQAQGDLRSVIGSGTCGGSHGSQCLDAVTAEACLHAADYFPSLLLDEPPIDPKDSVYSSVVTGYYLLVKDDQLEVGACGASGDPIVLSTPL